MNGRERVEHFKVFLSHSRGADKFVSINCRADKNTVIMLIQQIVPGLFTTQFMKAFLVNET